MPCQAIGQFLFYWMLLICLPLGIWTSIVLSKLKKILEAHSIEKPNIKEKIANAPEEVQKQHKLFKIALIVTIASALIWIVVGLVLKETC